MIDPWTYSTHITDPNIVCAIIVYDPSNNYGNGVFAWMTNKFQAYRIVRELKQKIQSPGKVILESCTNVDEFLNKHRPEMIEKIMCV